MSDPTRCGCARACSTRPYCDNCDLLVGVDGYHVLEVAERKKHLMVTIESPPSMLGVPRAGSSLRATADGSTRSSAHRASASALAVAQTHRDLPRISLRRAHVHRAGRPDRTLAGVAVDAGVLVGE